MKVTDFDYELPEELIAQHPVEPRDTARLLTLDKVTGEVVHKEHFYDLLEELHEGDVLVFNNTKVIPARLYGHRQGSGGKVEVLLLTPCGENRWECLVHIAIAGTICSDGSHRDDKVTRLKPFRDCACGADANGGVRSDVLQLVQADLGARRADAGGDAGNIHAVIGTLCGTKLPVEFQIYRIFPLLFDKLDPFRRARQQNVGGNLALRQADVKLCVSDAGKFSVQCVFHVVLL
mgnify:CR=1 FL=1